MGLLTIVFITLKLTGHIDWSWWWVLAPFWGPFALIAIIGLLALIVIGIGELMGGRRQNRRRFRP